MSDYITKQGTMKDDKRNVLCLCVNVGVYMTSVQIVFEPKKLLKILTIAFL